MAGVGGHSGDERGKGFAEEHNKGRAEEPGEILHSETSVPVTIPLLALDPGTVISHGEETLSRKQKLIEKVLEQSHEIALGRGLFGHCLAVRADSVSNLRSELGHQLANKSRNQNLRGIGAIVYKVPELNNDEMLKISLRSVDTEDTTPISQEYGGGGHRNASSFLISSAEFEKWKV